MGYVGSLHRSLHEGMYCMVWELWKHRFNLAAWRKDGYRRVEYFVASDSEVLHRPVTATDPNLPSFVKGCSESAYPTRWKCTQNPVMQLSTWGYRST